MTPSTNHSFTEEHMYYLKFIYDLAISAGYDEKEATNLSEMGLFKKQFENIRYSEKHEKQLKDLFIGKHH